MVKRRMRVARNEQVQVKNQRRLETHVLRCTLRAGQVRRWQKEMEDLQLQRQIEKLRQELEEAKSGEFVDEMDERMSRGSPPFLPYWPQFAPHFLPKIIGVFVMATARMDSMQQETNELKDVLTGVQGQMHLNRESIEELEAALREGLASGGVGGAAAGGAPAAGPAAGAAGRAMKNGRASRQSISLPGNMSNGTRALLEQLQNNVSKVSGAGG